MEVGGDQGGGVTLVNGHDVYVWVLRGRVGYFRGWKLPFEGQEEETKRNGGRGGEEERKAN